METGNCGLVTLPFDRTIVPNRHKNAVLADEKFDTSGSETVILPQGLKLKCIGQTTGYYLKEGSGIQPIPADVFQIVKTDIGNREVKAFSKLYQGYVFLMSSERQAAHLSDIGQF